MTVQKGGWDYFQEGQIPLKGNAFIFSDYFNNSGTTSNAFQIVNPTDSGVRIILTKLAIAPGASGEIRVYVNNTQLANEVTANNSGAKDTNLPDQLANWYGEVDITPDGTQIMSLNMAANTYEEYSQFEGFIIQEGHNLCFFIPTDVVLRPTVSWIEEPIG